MLQTSLLGHEVVVLLIIGATAIIIFTLCIAVLVYETTSAARYKKESEDNAKAFQDLQKADKVLLTPVSNDVVVSKLRSNKF